MKSTILALAVTLLVIVLVGSPITAVVFLIMGDPYTAINFIFTFLGAAAVVAITSSILDRYRDAVA